MRAIPGNAFLDRKFQVRSHRCALVLYLLILSVGNFPGARADLGHYAPGALLHALAYGLIAALLFFGSDGGRNRRALKAVLTVMAMGAADECLQGFFPYRNADLIDWAVDVIAATGCSALLWTLWPIKGEQISHS